MNDLQIFLIFLLILAGGLLLFFGAIHLTKRHLNDRVSVRSVFKDFGQKMWLTTGLGIYFCVLYFFVVYAVSSMTTFIGSHTLFQLLYQHPIAFSYLGLFIFVLVTAITYLARMVIKYLYNRRYKS